MAVKKKSVFKHYAIGVLIAIGFYLLSCVLGSLVNILVAHLFGYKKSIDLFVSHTFVAIILFIVTGLLNHVFFGWLTVDMLSVYGWRHNYMTIWSFRSAAIAVSIIATIIVPVLIGDVSGWMTYCSHIACILFFGRRRYKIYASEHPSSETDVNDEATEEIVKENHTSGVFAQPAIPAEIACEFKNEANSVEPTVNAVLPDMVESQVSKTISYCRHCGAKIEGESEYCGFCGTKIIKEIEL